MKEMRRIIALVLTLVMVVGMVPLGAFAAEADVDYLFFATDRHDNGSIINTLLTKMQNDGAAIEYVGLGGDMVDGQDSYNTKDILDDEVNAALDPDLDYTQVDFIKGSHDNNASDTSGYEMFHKKSEQLYAEEDYVVYGVIQSDMESDTGAADTFATWAENVDADKVIIVLSHLPIHQKRNDNNGAAAWHAALNSVADSNGDGTVDRNVIFFHGHNHSQDKTNYFYDVGDGIKVQGMSGSQTNYYTYATAGYLNDCSQATLVTVTDTTVTLTRYGTGSATELTTVERVADVAEPEETTAPTTEAKKEVNYMTISEGNGVAYVVGDKQILYKMYVSYTDGTEGYATQDDCTLTIYNEAGEVVTEAEALATVGTYNADITYMGVTCGTWLTFTVDASGDSSYDLLNLIINGAEVTADVKNVTADVADAMSGLDIDGYVAYDITADLAEGATATVSIPVPAEWADTDLTVYYVTDAGTLSDETFEDAAYADGYVTFTVKHFSSYAVTSAAKDGSSAEVPGNSTSQNKDVWVKVDTLTDGEEYLIVSTGTAGTSGYIMGNSTAVTPVSGSLTVNNATGTYTYFETATGTLWTASGSGTSWSFENSNGTYLGYTNSYYSYSLNTTSDSETEWTMGNNTLYVRAGSRTRYVRYSNGWQLSTSSGNVYFYQKVNATVHSGTQDAEYGINITVNGTAASAMNANNVVSGDTLELGTVFTSTVTGQAPASGGTYAWTATTNNGVASVDNSGKVTFTGKAGTETVQVSYTWTENGNEYTISNTLVITATAMSYTMDITEETLTVKIGANGTATLVAKNSEGTTVTASNVTWTSSNTEIATVANGRITGVKSGDVTVTAKWTDPAGVEHTDTVAVSVVDAVYALTIDQGDAATQKGVKAGDTLQLTATLTADGTAVTNPTLTWYAPYLADGSSAESIATIDSTGKLTFTGAEGVFKVMVAYTTPSGKTVNDIIEVTARKSTATTPSESTSDFPRWPDEGAIRFDKTASAVGNFSETGIAQVELSMAGLPVTKGGAVDVVLVLDASGSMTSSRISASIAAAKTFAQQICYTDGVPNQNRIAVVFFGNSTHYPVSYSDLGNSTTYGYALATASGNWEESTLYSCINGYCGKTSSGALSGGTKYQEALSVADRILTDAKTDGTGNDRSQYLLFMTDGAPTEYNYVTNYDAVQAGTADTYTMGEATGQNKDNASSTTAGRYEYYTACMKQRNVTVYTVGTALTATDNANSVEFLRKMATDDNKAYAISESDVNSGKLANAFSTIATEINAAASNVLVEDTIGENYDLIFELPAAFSAEEAANAGLAGQEFYIEVLDYPLDTTTHERTGEATVLQRIYLKTVNGNVTISKIEAGSIDSLAEVSKTPVFTAKAEADDKAYYTWTDSNNNGVADTGEYQNVPDGTGTHQLTAGAYLVLDTEGALKELHAANFMYDVASEQLRWSVTEMSQTSEVALRYFVYLDSSGGVTPADQIAAGTYYTNEEASLTYTNFKGTECLQYFPKPQMTWNGAQVSYVFYLVNENGVPVNRAGREVTFAEAVFVTDIQTYSIVWNDLEQSAGLEAKYLADDLIPDDYELYDENAKYDIHVYEDENAVNLNNHFVISGTSGDKTTYVYNNKTDIKKYNTHGVYAASRTYLCKSYLAEGNYTVTDGVISNPQFTAGTGETQALASNMTSTSGGQVIGGYVYYIDEFGKVYTIVQKTDATAITGFDFSNTTVAFAVVWDKKLVNDTVVVDFGLPVDINVTANDFVYNYITGIGATDPNYGINEGYKTDNATLTAQELTIKGHKIAVKDENTIRFTPGNGDSMIFNESVNFYYETNVEAYENGAIVDSFMYAKVTVVPATTVYYEDSFVDFAVSTKGDNGWAVDSNKNWSIVGSTDANATQAQDRPGASQISSAMDADNLYGFDGAYANRSTYSLGSARKISVDLNTFGTATFTFYGTGFDVIGLTSNNTGFITVSVYAGDSATGSPLKTFGVDTYYGYSYLPCKITMQRTPTSWDETGREVVSQADYDANKGGYGYVKPGNDMVLPNGTITYYYEMRWVATPGNGDNSNSIYQIPVISADLLAHGLSYGQYTVVVKCAYNKYLDHTNDTENMTNHTVDSYDFFLDAIRIYNPTGGNDSAANDAYVADGERWPFYEELRSKVITADTFNILDNAGVANGVVYIDGNTDVNNFEDYYFYGPNNELYLDKDQAVAFYLDAPTEGLESIQLGLKNIQGNGSVKVYAVNPIEDLYNAATETVTKLGENSVSSTITDGIITTVNVVYEEGENEGEYLKHTVTMAYRIINGLDMDLKTATDMNYDITKLNGYPVVILNDSTAEGNVISITTVKATYDAPRPVGLVVTGKTEYVVGEEFEPPTVTVYYADGTTLNVTSEYEDISANTTVVDVYELSYDYSEEVNGEWYDVSTTFTVNVVAAEEASAVAAASAPASDYSMLKVTRSAVSYAVASLSKPVIVESGNDAPAGSDEPEATEPEATEPEATEPEATEPEATEPENNNSQNNGSQNNGSQNNGSQNNEPEADKPESNETEATEPEVDTEAPGAAAPEDGKTEDNDAVVDDSEAETPDEAPETGDEPVEEVTGFWGLLKKIIEFLFGWLLKLK